MFLFLPRPLKLRLSEDQFGIFAGTLFIPYISWGFWSFLVDLVEDPITNMVLF